MVRAAGRPAMLLQVLPFAVAGVLLAACGERDSGAADADEAGAAPRPAAAAGTSLAPPVPAPRLIRVPAVPKLRVYIDCYNDLDERARNALTAYFLSVDPEGLGAGRPVPSAPGAIDVRDLLDCRTRTERAAAQAPRMEPLDGAAADYLRQLTALTAPLNETATYYRQQDYKDDDFAKGRALHPRLLNAYQAFVRASRAFAAGIDAEEAREMPAQLAQIEKKQGRKAAYWNLALALEAQQAMRMLAADSVDADAARQRIDGFERVAADAMAYMDANPRERPVSWNIVHEYTEAFRRATKARMRRVRDNTPYTPGEQELIRTGSAVHVAGTAHQVMQAYNGLVGMVNSGV